MFCGFSIIEEEKHKEVCFNLNKFLLQLNSNFIIVQFVESTTAWRKNSRQ